MTSCYPVGKRQLSTSFCSTESVSSTIMASHITWDVPASRGTELHELDDESIVHILSFVSQYYRLRACAAVCSRFRRLALAATNSISIVADHHAMCRYRQALAQYCTVHGNHISSLKVLKTPVDLPWEYTRFGSTSTADTEWQNLPCANVQQLQLAEFDVQLGTSSDKQGLFVAYSGLTHLSLQHCSISDTAEALAALPALSRLRHLDLHAIMGRPARDFRKTTVPIPGCVLSQTLQLTHLRLAGAVVDDTLSHLGCCSLLQHLVLDLGDTLCYWDVTAPVLQEGLQHLTALTHLAIHFTKDQQLQLQEGEPPFITSSSIPSLSRLTALESLSVYSASAFDPAVLQNMTRLTSLSVVSTPLVGGPAALLAVLPRLRCILRLDLAKSFRCVWVARSIRGAWCVDMWRQLCARQSSAQPHELAMLHVCARMPKCCCVHEHCSVWQ